MKGQTTLFSKESDHWTTPKDLYQTLNKEFLFNCDPAPLNCPYDTLKDSFKWGSRCFINPPYSNIKGFLEKAYREMTLNDTSLCVFLIPARTDTRWFHDYIYQKVGVEIRFIKGRLKFGDSKNSAPFPSMIVIMRKYK